MKRTEGADRVRRQRSTAMQLVAVLLVALALAGCGKKGDPQPPPDQPNTFPRNYPRE